MLNIISIREIQIKTMRYHFTSIRMAIIIKTVLRIGKDVNKYCVDETVKWYSHLENSLTVPQNIKHRGTMWPSNSTSRYLRDENVCLHKDFNLNVYGSIIHTSSKVETMQMYIYLLVNEYKWHANVVYPYSGILLGNKKK